MILNLQQLRKLTQGDVAIEQELAVLFCATAERCLASLQASAADAGKGAQWPLLLHELRGAALNLYAQELAELCRQYEPLATVPQRQSAASELLLAYGQLRTQLTPLLSPR